MKMAPQTPSVALPWKSQIHQRVALLKFCLATSNDGLLHALVAQDFTNPQDVADLECQRATAKSNQDELAALKKELVELGVQGIDTVKKVFDATIQKFEPLEHSSPEEIEKAIRDGMSNLKNTVNDKLDELEIKAIEKIRSIPQQDREPAARVFNGIASVITTYLLTTTNKVREIFDALAPNSPVSYQDAIRNAKSTSETAARETKKLIESFGETEGPTNLQQLADVAKRQVDAVEQGFKQEMEKYTQSLDQGGKEKFDQSLQELFGGVKKVIVESQERTESEGLDIIDKLPEEKRQDGAKALTDILAAFMTYSFSLAYLIKDVANAGFDGHKDAVEKAVAANTAKAEEAKKAIQDVVGKNENPGQATKKADRFTVKLTEKGWELSAL